MISREHSLESCVMCFETEYEKIKLFISSTFDLFPILAARVLQYIVHCTIGCINTVRLLLRAAPTPGRYYIFIHPSYLQLKIPRKYRSNIRLYNQILGVQVFGSCCRQIGRRCHPNFVFRENRCSFFSVAAQRSSTRSDLWPAIMTTLS